MVMKSFTISQLVALLDYLILTSILYYIAQPPIIFTALWLFSNLYTWLVFISLCEHSNPGYLSPYQIKTIQTIFANQDPSTELHPLIKHYFHFNDLQNPNKTRDPASTGKRPFYEICCEQVKF